MSTIKFTYFFNRSDEAAIDERRFGIRLEQERIEFNHFQQMNVPDYHITCSMPAPAQWTSMLKQAENRFNTLLAISQQEALNNGGNARELLASRLRTRFNEGMCFSIVLEESKLKSCPTKLSDL